MAFLPCTPQFVCLTSDRDACDSARAHQVKRTRGNDFFKHGYYARALKLYEPVVKTFFMKMPARPSDAVAAAEKGKGGQPQVQIPFQYCA